MQTEPRKPQAERRHAVHGVALYLFVTALAAPATGLFTEFLGTTVPLASVKLIGIWPTERVAVAKLFMVFRPLTAGTEASGGSSRETSSFEMRIRDRTGSRFAFEIESA